MDNKRLTLIEIRNFLEASSKPDSKSEYLLWGLLLLFFGIFENYYVMFLGLFLIFTGLKARAVKYACDEWAELLKKYILDTYEMEWSDCCAFYHKDAPISDEKHYHNPEIDECWMENTVLFNIDRWDDKLCSYKMLPDYISEVRSVISMKDVIFLGTFRDPRYFKKNVLSKIPWSFPSEITEIILRK
jgi:hypothetical protein